MNKDSKNQEKTAQDIQAQTEGLIEQPNGNGNHTEQNAGQEGKSVNGMLKDALADIRKAESSQRESKIDQGRRMVRFEVNFKTRRPNGDAFKSLAVASEEDHGLTKYTDRHLRNLASFASLYDEIKEWLVAEARKAGINADPIPPAAEMTHYLAVCVAGLGFDKKVQLLRFAEKYGWSVKFLEERVRRELGIPPTSWDDFGNALAKAEKAISKLTKFIEGNNFLEAGRLTAIWRLNSKIADYGKAQAEVVPEGMRDSIPTCKATKVA